MGTFATKKILPGNPSLIPAIAEQIRTEFMAEQFEVQIDNLLSGGVDISKTKGNLFKAVLGLKSALKVSLIPKDNAIAFEAGIGIFGQQAIPLHSKKSRSKSKTKFIDLYAICFSKPEMSELVKNYYDAE